MAYRREWRHAELMQLRHSDPAKIIELFHMLAPLVRMPEVSFSRMIEAILDDEEARDILDSGTTA